MQKGALHRAAQPEQQDHWHTIQVTTVLDVSVAHLRSFLQVSMFCLLSGPSVLFEYCQYSNWRRVRVDD
eukprot:2595273-Amphidinium_carterae.1